MTSMICPKSQCANAALTSNIQSVFVNICSKPYRSLLRFAGLVLIPCWLHVSVMKRIERGYSTPAQYLSNNDGLLHTAVLTSLRSLKHTVCIKKKASL